MHPEQLLQHASQVIAQMLSFAYPADRVISHYFRENKSLGPRERATLAETAYRVLRQKPLFELIARSAPKGMGNTARRMAMLGFDAPRDFLKAGLRPDEKTWLQAADERMSSQEGLLDLHRHNFPQWLADMLKAQIGDALMPLALASNQSAPLDLRVNIFKSNRDDAQAELTQAGIQAVATALSPWALRIQGKPALAQSSAFKQGMIEVQDEGSQLLAWLTGAKRGEMVADFCAGAGGKTLALGAMMKNTGRLYAFDTSAHRLDAMKPRLARSGLSNIHPVAIAHERDERIKRLAGKMDRVLVDAPCSGLGTLRRNPDLKWRQTPADIEQLANKQIAILSSAARLLKPGGRLVYATCSLLREENEAIAEQFNQLHPQWMPLDVADLLQALPMSKDQALKLCCASTPSRSDHPDKNETESIHYLRLWPHLHNTDGFFAAVWQKL